MKVVSIHKNKKKVHKNPRGFILPFTMLISVLVLFITTGALALLSKQQYFSRLYKQTQTAYYAADDAISCATLIDDTYVSSDGLGIFPSSSTDPTAYINDTLSYVSARQGTTISLADVTCGQSPIFAYSHSFDPKFAVSPTEYAYHFTNPVSHAPDIEYGKTSSYSMRMDLGIDPLDTMGTRHLYRCAKVTINKTASFRQIIAQGYSTCDGTSNSVERAVVNTTIIE